MVYAETRIYPLNEMNKILWDFLRETDPQLLARKSELVIINKKRRKKRKRTCHLLYFAVPADCRMKVKDSEKINQYLDLARELKKLWNMRETVIAITFWCAGNDPKREWNSWKSEEKSKTFNQKSTGDRKWLNFTQIPVKSPPADSGVKN